MASSSRSLVYWPRQVMDPLSGSDGSGEDGTLTGGQAAAGGDTDPNQATYDSGQWTASTIAAAVTSASLASASSSSASMDSSSSIDSSSASTPSSSSASIAASSSSLLPSPTVDPKQNAAAQNGKPGGWHLNFHIAYLTPLFVILGLVLIFAIGGRVWGRISYAREQAQMRRNRYERQMARSQRRAARSQTTAEGSSVAGSGWRSYEDTVIGEDDDEEQAKTMIEKADYLGHRDSGDEGEEEYDDDDEIGKGGPLSALSSHIAYRSARPLPPSSRDRGAGRYETKVQSNSWFAVRWRRWTAFMAPVDFSDDAYTAPPGPLRARNGSLEEQQRGSAPRAPVRGTWARVKQGLTGDVGWGYKGEAPTINERRQMVSQALPSQASGLWTQAPPRPPSSLTQEENLPHLVSGSGLLDPPRLADEGMPYLAGEGPEYDRGRRPGRSIFPLSRLNQRDRSYSPPSERIPQSGTFAALANSASKQGIASIREIFGAMTGSNSNLKSNSKGNLLGDGSRPRVVDSTSRGVPHPLASQVDLAGAGNNLQGVQIHTHKKGDSCALNEPQYLPPHAVLLARKDSSFKPVHSPVSLHDNAVFYGEAHTEHPTTPPVARAPSVHGQVTASSSGRNVPSSGLGQTMRVRSVSSRSIAHDADEGVGEQRHTPRNKEGKEKTILKRASTVRFALSPDRDESAATSFATDLSRYAAADSENKAMDVDEVPKDLTPTKPLSRAQTTATRKKSALRRPLNEDDANTAQIKRFRSLQSSTTTSSSDLARKQSSRVPAARKIMSPASVTSSTRETPQPYTELVNFGDYDEEDDDAAKEDFQRRASYGSSVPGLSSGGSSTGEDEEERDLPTRSPDMESEIDSVLLSVIARSNSSRSVMPFYRSDNEEDDKVSTPQKKLNRNGSKMDDEMPKGTPTTPLGRKKTWQRMEDGRWGRVSLDEEEWQELQRQQQQQQQFDSPAMSMRSDSTHRGFAARSPPPLPTPPPTAALPRALRVASPSPTRRRDAASPGPASSLLGGIQQAFDTPSVYSMASPASSTVSGATPRPAHGSLDERIMFSHGKAYGDADALSLGSTATFSSSASSSERRKRKQQEQQQGRSGPAFSPASLHDSPATITTASKRRRNSGAELEEGNMDVDQRMTDGEDGEGSPRRRGGARRPPRRYQARLAPEAPAESTGASGAPIKRTGKTLKTPAQKEKDNEFAMDRVQSMIAKAHAQRLNAQQIRQQEQ